MTCQAPWLGTKHREAFLHACSSTKIKAPGKRTAGPGLWKRDSGHVLTLLLLLAVSGLELGVGVGVGAFTLKETLPPRLIWEAWTLGRLRLESQYSA